MENTEKKGTKARSRLYPRYDLEDSIEFIEAVEKLGGSRVSNEAVAAEVGKAVNNSTFIGRVSSSKQFNLLLQESGKLSLSSLGKQIMYPTSEQDKSTAIKSAFSAPALYRELLDSFNGKTLPEQSALANRLVHDYGIEASAKESAARNFIRSAQYAKVLQNGILIISSDETTTAGEDEGEEQSFSITPVPGEGASVKQKQLVQVSAFNDFGDGWNLTIKSSKPLNSEVKKRLIEVSELLEQINGDANARN